MTQETIAQRYINELAELYNVTDKNRDKMYDGAEQIENALGKYQWDDVKHALQLFYARKNDKSRPRLAQILAILESDPRVTPVATPEPEPEPAPVHYDRPTTKIWAIRKDFDQMIDILTDAGVLPNEQGEYRNTRSIINPDTDLPVLNPMQWLGWKLADAIRNRPDLFARYPYANKMEQLAIAMGNRLITFKIRDWAKLAKAKKGGNK